MMNNMKKLLILAAATTLALVSCSQKAQTSVNPAEYKSANPEGMKTVQDFLKAIQTGHVKNVAKQIAANPKVAICAFDGSKWLRITTTLVEDPRVEIKKAMLDANPGLRSMYNENDDNTAIFFMTEAKATINSFTEPVVEIDF